MKALSLTQPWATLVACGRKKIETRSWSTKYRGPLYIHAAKGFPRWAQDFARDVYGNPAVLPYIPRGAIVARVYLLDVKTTEYMLPRITSDERRFGDYSRGRYAWIFSNVEWLEPFSYKGQLGLFEVSAEPIVAVGGRKA